MSYFLHFFPLSRCSWLCLSDSSQLLHSKQVRWKCMSSMCTWRNGCNEDTHATDLWNTGNAYYKLRTGFLILHNYHSCHLLLSPLVLYILHMFFLYFSPAGHNMQWCFDDLLLWNIWNVSNDQRNSYQEWRDLVTVFTNHFSLKIFLWFFKINWNKPFIY